MGSSQVQAEVDPILSVRNLNFSYGTSVILQEVSFDVAPGERIAVIGPNGAGKSTLLRCCAGILTGESGEIQLQGQRLSNMQRVEIARAVAYVPQLSRVSAPYLVKDLLYLSRYPFRGCRPFEKEDREQVEWSLQFVPAGDFLERPYGELSGGEQRLVQLAAALVQAPKLLLLDEPLAFLDPKHQVVFYRALLRAQQERQFSVIAVTHEVNFGVAVAHRLIGLARGQVAFDGAPDELELEERLESLFGVPLDQFQREGGQRCFAQVFERQM